MAARYWAMVVVPHLPARPPADGDEALILPKTDGKYQMTFENFPVVSRWRNEDGQWKMFYFTSDKGTALDEMKKDGID